MSIQIQVRRGTASGWTAANPTLGSGEIGFETDTGLFKIGTGSTAWTSLAYAGNSLGYTTTATAAGTTTLTSASSALQIFTGSTTQTVALPAVSTLYLGKQYYIYNNSTGTVTINSSGGNAVISLIAGASTTLTAIATTGTNAAVWDYQYDGFDTITGTGSLVLGTSPTVSGLILTGTLTAASSAGTSGQVLSSTGSGVQWSTPAGGAAFSEFLLIGA